MAKAPETPTKRSSEVRNATVSCVHLLDDDELLTGTVTITSSPSGLTFSNARTNTAAVTVKGVPVPAGKALQFSVAGGSSNILYSFQARCGTDATPAQMVAVGCRLFVSDD